MKGIRCKKKRVRNADVKENHRTFNEKKKNYKKSRPIRSVSYSNIFLKKMFENKTRFEMEDWIQLFLKSIIIKDFMNTIPHFRIFERMLSITSRHITGSKLKSFFAEFIVRMENLDVSVIPLFFEWCYILYRQKLNFSKNQIREDIRYEILRDALLGIVSGKARNYIIMLIGCDLDISTKYLFPNSQISNWKEEFEEYFEEKYSLRDLKNDFWGFALQIFKSLAEENSIRESLFELKLRDERTCLCKIDDWIVENSSRSTHIEWFRDNSNFLSNNKLLLILFSSFINFFPFTIEFFPLTVELILNTKIENCNSKIQSNSNFENKNLYCSCKHDKISFNSYNEIYYLIIYLISSLIFIYYGIEYELLDEFNLIYEESFNILHYLTSGGKNDNSSFYKYESSNHLLQIKHLIDHFRKHPSLIIKMDEVSSQIIENNNSFVVLVFDSILNIYKFRNKQKNLIMNEKNEIFEEILITLLFLVILHPNTSDNTILYLFNSIYEELYSFGFLLIGSCMTLLYKKDIFPEGISKSVQLNISNFRNIHLINSQIFPYIQFMNCTYHLISKNIENFRIINMIFQLLEGNYLQYIRNVPQMINSKKNNEENNLSINISLALTSIYMKLLEFFHLNPSLCKLFFKMKHYIQKSGPINQHFLDEKDFTKLTKCNPKVSLLGIFNQLSENKEFHNSKNLICEPKDKLIENLRNINALNDLHLFKMNYSTMIHLITILYIPIIKRVNMSLYKFKYSIYPLNYLIGEDVYFNNSECEFNDKIFEIEQQGVSIPKQFCIEFLEEVINYCKNLGIESPFDIDRFILKNPLDNSSININGQSISSLIHTCANENKKKCFVCCIDSYAEYLGIINAFHSIGEEIYQSYYISKSWVYHALIISIVTIINSSINIDGMNRVDCSEIKTLIRISNKIEYSFYNNLTIELLEELINILINEIKDDAAIMKESGDPQRIIFRSLLIYLLIIVLNNELGRTILSNIDFQYLLVRLCHLFSFRIECLATNVYNNIETDGKNELINAFDGFSTPNIRRTPNSSNSDINDQNITPFSVASKKSCIITPINKKRITPIIISRNSSSNKRSISILDEQNNNNTNGVTNLALKEDTKSYSCIFHLKIILNAINIIREFIPQDLSIVNNNFIGEKFTGVQNSNTEFVLNIMENSLFFLLPSNTISKRSIFNLNNINEANNEFNYEGLNTIHEGSEISEAEEIDNLNEIDKQSSQLRNPKCKISVKTNIPYLLNDDDFSKDWYMEIIIYLIKFIINNTQLVKDISSIITDIASRITLWSRKENKTLIFNVCVEVLKFSHDYFYDELPEISLCILRNSGFQLLQSIKFVFVAILDQNSLLIDNTLNDLPSINVMVELESLHRVIFVFNRLVGIFEICFQVIFFNGNNATDKDNLWLKNANNLIEMGIETLSTELSKMERIKLLPKIDDDEEFFDKNKNTNGSQNLEEFKCASSNEVWSVMILDCNAMLRECEYVHNLISSNWVDHNSLEQSKSNKRNNNCNIKEIDDDLDNFITFEQCDEGILQENESYSDIKLTPHWNTFIKSLFL